MRFYPLIEIFNESTVLSNAEVSDHIPNLQFQLNYHFRPYWDSWARLKFVDKPTDPKAWRVGIFDDSDQAGALGYHDFMPGVSGSVPTASVFAKTDRDYHLSWTVTLSHELLEMLADPYIMLGAQVTDTDWYAWEICDPVEADQLGYWIHFGQETIQTLVSNFITPAWFIPTWKSATYDYKNDLSEPLQVTDGGYVSIYSNGAWNQYQQQKAALVPVPLENNVRFRHRGNIN